MIGKDRPPPLPPQPAQLSPPISALLGHTMALQPVEWAAFVPLQSAVGAVKIHLGPYTTWTENAIRKAKKKKREEAEERDGGGGEGEREWRGTSRVEKRSREVQGQNLPFKG